MTADGRAARLLGRLVPWLAGIAYVFTAGPSVLGGDNGELAGLGAVGGVAHPPGYPLYVLVLRAFAWLPASSPAHRAALVTAVVGALAVAALAWAARAWGASRLSAAIAAGLFAFGPLAWTLSTHAEVFALNILCAMLLVGLSCPSAKPPAGSELARASAIGLVAGLGVSNHHSIVLMAPVALVGLVTALARTRPRAHAARAVLATLTAAAAFAVGLLPYAYVLVRARAASAGDACTWGYPRTVSGLVAHFLRTDYGTFQLGISSAKPEVGAHVLALVERLFVDLFGAPVVLVAGLVAAARARDRSTPPRAYVPLAALVSSLLLAGPIFAARFNLPAHGLAALVTQRFHLLPLAVACVLLALATDACLRASASARVATFVGFVAPAFLVVRAVISYPDVREHHRPTTELYLRNVLRMVPEGAVILGSGDDLFGGFMYARCALGLRPDVEFIAPHMLLTDWYPPRVDARLGIPLVRASRDASRDGSREAGRRVLPARDLLAQLLATGRPVFVTDWFAKGLEKAAPSYPIGPLIRVVPSPTELPDPDALATANERVFSAMELEPIPPEPDTWGAIRAADYARPWLVLGDAFAERGSADRAEEMRRRARILTP